MKVYKGIWGYMKVYKGGPNAPCAQSRMARTAREHEALMARNVMSNHTCSDRTLPTCKASIVVTATIFILFEANTKDSFVVAAEGRHLRILALNRVNIVAVTTILAFHVGNGRSEHV